MLLVVMWSLCAGRSESFHFYSVSVRVRWEKTQRADSRRVSLCCRSGSRLRSEWHIGYAAITKEPTAAFTDHAVSLAVWTVISSDRRSMRAQGVIVRSLLLRRQLRRQLSRLCHVYTAIVSYNIWQCTSILWENCKTGMLRNRQMRLLNLEW